MKGKWLFALLLLVSGFSLRAQNAYEIKVTLKPFNSGYLYLAHHFGSKQYLIDSAKLNTSSEAVFTGKEKLFGGVYMIVFPQKNGWIECIIDKEQKFEVVSDTANLLSGTEFRGSNENLLFTGYQKKSYEIGTELAQLRKQASTAGKEEADKINERIAALGNELQQYRESFLKQHPDHLLSAIFRVLREPVIPPADEHPGGKYDSAYAYQYYKNHYWDGVSFKDERLMRTPVFQNKLDRYFNEVLSQSPDTLKLAVDQALQGAATNPEMFKYLLSTFTDKYINPTYMGQDAVFVHLFEKYYLTGQADYWMSEKYKKFVFDRGYSMMMNVVGNPGANFEFLDTLGKKGSLYAVASPYTVICFWDPTCSHCKEEVPKLDSLFQLKWKKQGIKLMGVMTDGGKEAWIKFIRDHKLKDWLHVYQTQAMKDADYAANKPGLRQLYDVYQTPMLYLLDKEKRIIAKKITWQQLDDLLQLKMNTASAK